MRQYLQAKFRASDKRAYTYHNDGPPVTVNDWIKIADRHRPDEWSRAIVVAIVEKPTAFETKPILGKLDGADVDKAIQEERAAAPPGDLFG